MTNDAAQAPVLIASHGAVRVLTLNRPEALNSFDAADARATAAGAGSSGRGRLGALRC